MFLTQNKKSFYLTFEQNVRSFDEKKTCGQFHSDKNFPRLIQTMPRHFLVAKKRRQTRMRRKDKTVLDEVGGWRRRSWQTPFPGLGHRTEIGFIHRYWIHFYWNEEPWRWWWWWEEWKSMVKYDKSNFQLAEFVHRMILLIWIAAWKTEGIPTDRDTCGKNTAIPTGRHHVRAKVFT